jgi:hypothetical protein
MFRAIHADLQESLHERRFGNQTTSIVAHNSHQTCVRVVSPEDGQVISETCRDFEP